MNRGPKLKIAFAGTPDFAVPALRRLCASDACQVLAVYTQPDRPAGRGRKVRTSPVKEFAIEQNISIFQPTNFKRAEDVEEFRALNLDVLVVAAYGLILPNVILDAATYPINIHASLLPRWRGAAPIQRAIMAGDKTSGVTIIRITEKLDAGPMWLTVGCPISIKETAGTLHDKLAALGADAIEKSIELIVTDKVVEISQRESEVTYAEKITSSDRILDFTSDAEHLLQQIRGLMPSPLASISLAGQDCKIGEAEIQTAAHQSAPGSIAFANKTGIGVNSRSNILNIKALQPAGKKMMLAADFVNGYGAQRIIELGTL
ncbi:MAG: methionyl-tRNA formyltransferase [Pseudomonadota bacterium]